VLVELGLAPPPEVKPPTRIVDVPTTVAPSTGARQPVDGHRVRTDATSLAIPGYDSLSASQVVQRLTGLTRSELEAVRAYEQEGRGRKTILTRVAQLQAAV
jgi:hypothetical protein